MKFFEFRELLNKIAAAEFTTEDAIEAIQDAGEIIDELTSALQDALTDLDTCRRRFNYDHQDMLFITNYPSEIKGKKAMSRVVAPHNCPPLGPPPDFIRNVSNPNQPEAPCSP
jgi:hypothetical protein